MVGVVMAPNGGLLDGPVHALDLAVRPRVVHLRQAVLDAVLVARAGRRCERRHGRPSPGGSNWMPLHVEHGVDAGGHGRHQIAKELSRGHLAGLLDQNLGQAADAMPAQASMQRGARQMRDRRLQGVEAVVERQERVTAEGHDDRLLLGGEHGGARLARPDRTVLDAGPSLPLRHRLRVQPVGPAQLRDRSLRQLVSPLARRAWSWRAREEPVLQGLLVLRRKPRTPKPRDQTPSGRDDGQPVGERISPCRRRPPARSRPPAGRSAGRLRRRWRWRWSPLRLERGEWPTGCPSAG